VQFQRPHDIEEQKFFKVQTQFLCTGDFCANAMQMQIIADLVEFECNANLALH
jgi:hypothetical protein